MQAVRCRRRRILAALIGSLRRTPRKSCSQHLSSTPDYVAFGENHRGDQGKSGRNESHFPTVAWRGQSQLYRHLLDLEERLPCTLTNERNFYLKQSASGEEMFTPPGNTFAATICRKNLRATTADDAGAAGCCNAERIPRHVMLDLVFAVNRWHTV